MAERPPTARHHRAARATDVAVLNKDIGFVRTGQPVRVKVEAYPFTDYGLIAGRVDRISSDAIHDEKLGLALVARLR
jgi:hemolysin D